MKHISVPGCIQLLPLFNIALTDVRHVKCRLWEDSRPLRGKEADWSWTRTAHQCIYVLLSEYSKLRIDIIHRNECRHQWNSTDLKWKYPEKSLVAWLGNSPFLDKAPGFYKCQYSWVVNNIDGNIHNICTKLIHLRDWNSSWCLLEKLYLCFICGTHI